jgi:glutathione S-transferase
MIELHYWPTSNGQKIAIFLEESGIAHELHPVNISKKEQFRPEFLKISPNNRIPAILDRAPANGGEPAGVFESGAILFYLADKTGQFLPRDPVGRIRAMEWVFWQIGGLGPASGQANLYRALRSAASTSWPGSIKCSTASLDAALFWRGRIIPSPTSPAIPPSPIMSATR